MTTHETPARRAAALAFVHRFTDSDAEADRLFKLLGVGGEPGGTPPPRVEDVLRDDFLAAWRELALSDAVDAPVRASARYAERREIDRLVAQRRAYEPLPDLWRSLVRRLDCAKVTDEVFRAFLVELGVEAAACAAATLLVETPSGDRRSVFGARVAVLFGETQFEAADSESPVRRIMERMEQLMTAPEPVDSELCQALLGALEQESRRLGDEESSMRAKGRPVSGLRRRSAYYLARRLVATLIRLEGAGTSAGSFAASPALSLLLAPKPLTLVSPRAQTSDRLRSLAEAALERMPALARVLKENS